ncbi:site-specific DNA-methyltransferase, partial [Bartonella queenslandensis]|uniref:site-specific DNA-methyltransferase n=1 Tax=Bartonella queenslandensis TaxID=481138 RepID=UPI000584607C
PPYNTGNAFEHYDDGLEHSTWLSLMRDRLELLRTLLAEDGSIWINLDDCEVHYAKVMCDEIFGRRNFVNDVIWQKKYSPQNDAKWLSDNHDFILVYAKNKDVWRPNLLTRSEKATARYKNPDNDPKGPWKLITLHAKSGNKTDFEYTFKNGVRWTPPAGTFARFSKDTLEKYESENKIWFGKDGNSIPSVKNYLSEVKSGVTALTIWTYDEVGHNHEAKKEVKQFNEQDPFSTPKPERLIERILILATNPGDFVLDSFLGSGTTAAVAHKMGRRWIGIELGEHCDTHCRPRLQKVIDGTDQGGISKAVNWQGGGGFRYYRLAPSMLEKDQWGNWVISKEYNAAMLTQAMCKHMGFTYAPDESHYWMQGYSTETDFIYVTTRALTHEQLRAISEEVGPNRTLLICCKAFNAKVDAF